MATTRSRGSTPATKKPSATKKPPTTKKPAPPKSTEKKKASTRAARAPKPSPPVAYYDTKAFLEAVGDGEPLEQIWFNVLEQAEAHGMTSDTNESVSERILDWEFKDPFWKEAAKIKVPRTLRVLVPFGKYAQDPDHGFEIYDYRCTKKVSSLLELLRFCSDKLADHFDKVLDGQLFGGFAVYPGDLWVFSLEA
jgi:hypothetical protein